MRARCRIAGLVALLGTLRSVEPFGLAERVDSKLEATIHLKALNYDRALKTRTSGSTLTVGVIYRSGGESEKVQRDITAAFRDIGKRLKVQGLTVQPVPILHTSEGLAAQLNDAGVNVIYVTPGMDSDLAKIHAAAVPRRAPTLCSDRDLVMQGVALGVFFRDGKPVLAVNLKIARELGMEMESALFSVAEVFK
jgi:hypothetical protein